MPGPFRSVLLLIALLWTIVPLRALEPDPNPFLRIETGMHTATIRGIGVDAGERYLVTGGDDKTVRVWELATGRLLQVLRPPLDIGPEGAIHAVAISPDGKTIACGGLTGFIWDNNDSIYLFDRASGEMRQRIGGLPEAIQSLKYSGDGRYLAVGLGRGGLRIYRTPEYEQAAGDADYSKEIYGLSFSADGRLATACMDGSLRIYSPEFKLLAKRKSAGPGAPFRIAFSPIGDRIAVSYAFATRIEVLSPRDLSLLYAPNVQAVKDDLDSVAWSADGRTLYASGSNLTAIRRWSAGGQGTALDLPTATHGVSEFAPLRESNDLVFAATTPEWGKLDAEGQLNLKIPMPMVNYRYLVPVDLNADASAIRFSYDGTFGGRRVFDFNAREVKPNSDAGLQPPRLEAPGLAVTHWSQDDFPQLNGHPLPTRDRGSYALAIAPKGDRFVLAADYTVFCFDRAGNPLWVKIFSATPRQVNIDANGQAAIAAYDDGVIRWFRLSDGKLFLSFFAHADRKRWITFTPSGYFDCSPGGEDFIGWHLNRGKDRAADFFPASHFRDTYYRPDIVAQTLKSMDEEAGIRIANEQAGRAPPPIVTVQLPPVVQIAWPPDNSETDSTRLALRYTVRTPGGEPVTAVRALIDGRPVAATRDLHLVKKDGAKGDEQTLAIALPDRDCEVSLIAENRFASSVPAVIRVQRKQSTPGQFVIKPKLYVLAIGISNYADPELKLTYPAKDAKDFAAAVAAQKGGLYRDVEMRVLADKDATKENIIDGLDWIQHATTAKDVAMIFLSGHGYNAPNGTYYFIPQNFNREKLRATAVENTEIAETVKNTAGKVICFLDSCHSGNLMNEGARKSLLDVNAVVNELSSAENGAVVFCASTSKQVALENPDWKNGAFTCALVEGLKGAADYNHNGRITVNMLDLYISERVKELTKGTQTPTTTKPPSIPDFPLAVQSRDR